jgi:FAD/FMN-containing dehydrogenase
MNDLTLATLDLGSTTVDAEALTALAARMRGVMLTKEDEAYDQTRSVWNAMIDRRPGLIIRCAGAADVREAVRFARDNRLLVAVRGGGPARTRFRWGVRKPGA